MQLHGGLHQGPHPNDARVVPREQLVSEPLERAPLSDIAHGNRLRAPGGEDVARAVLGMLLQVLIAVERGHRGVGQFVERDVAEGLVNAKHFNEVVLIGAGLEGHLHHQDGAHGAAQHFHRDDLSPSGPDDVLELVAHRVAEALDGRPSGLGGAGCQPREDQHSGEGRGDDHRLG